MKRREFIKTATIAATALAAAPLAAAVRISVMELASMMACGDPVRGSKSITTP